MTFNAGPEIGRGIYTIPEASQILSIPKSKVRSWIKKYWELEFAEDQAAYTWGESRERAFNFYTLIELIAVKSFRELGLSFPKIKEAHKILSEVINSQYPFATSKLLSDGKNIFYELSESELLDVDKKLQYSFRKIVLPYCKKLEFSEKSFLATRYWPLGKNHNIVVDPHHSFGQPTILGTNIPVYSIINYLKAGEDKEVIQNLFEIEGKSVNDVVLYNKHIAA